MTKFQSFHLMGAVDAGRTARVAPVGGAPAAPIIFSLAPTLEAHPPPTRHFLRPLRHDEPQQQNAPIMNIDLLDTVLVSHTEQTAARPDAMTTSKDAPTPPSASGDVDKCPVDHKTRETWIQQARAADAASASASSSTKPEPQPTSSWTSWLPFSRSSSSTPTSSTTTAPALPPNHPSLDESRVVSTIPRASTTTTSPPTAAARPSNHELETGASPGGNWIYPSEKMFFDAMKRKGFDSARAADMKTVVPIHNAVNERAWAEILQWEAPYATPACGGPRLHSFAGLSERMTPKARINTLLGYTAPFDRHDWVVDRCGTQVEYVIDFYAGRNDGSVGKLNFYLDVRPKLNTWEGVKMRAWRATGLA
ncbi:cytochrome c/c1 heme lyase-domain-containing protein [Schizothecium vesticola]|uniref:Holocytochrome c-type synthase n=1 Tax=Schizothecium vesticola TaxID=314040 RepID=A0AA40BP29_9PEZI|nr:cytochrome c/c1 heme lyase-domain-containing protein [Schizothecium vesticola]